MTCADTSKSGPGWILIDLVEDEERARPLECVLVADIVSKLQNAAFRVIPVLSAAVIVCLGLLMTGVSLGVIRPSRFIG